MSNLVYKFSLPFLDLSSYWVDITVSIHRTNFQSLAFGIFKTNKDFSRLTKYVFPINLPANYEQKESQYIYSRATLSKLWLRVTIALRAKDTGYCTGKC